MEFFVFLAAQRRDLSLVGFFKALLLLAQRHGVTALFLEERVPLSFFHGGDGFPDFRVKLLFVLQRNFLQFFGVPIFKLGQLLFVFQGVFFKQASLARFQVDNFLSVLGQGHALILNGLVAFFLADADLGVQSLHFVSVCFFEMGLDRRQIVLRLGAFFAEISFGGRFLFGQPVRSRFGGLQASGERVDFAFPLLEVQPVFFDQFEVLLHFALPQRRQRVDVPAAQFQLLPLAGLEFRDVVGELLDQAFLLLRQFAAGLEPFLGVFGRLGGEVGFFPQLDGGCREAKDLVLLVGYFL
ncbi:hypothetical protein RAH42_06175 [Pyramidobacter sp. YE332]|uniref:hypothetical protein n=1 Tax=Pyramidobacter sp. YE332 TaxID=3068894 RepID=UPI00294B5914|nr:hypothetical protein [Pyramidobacter sp. YE332]WOL41222.1 hypothetical protein RAH42_06175 [Pyramidobacter sp. YE332]